MQLGTATIQQMPCPSAFDPGADDYSDDEAEMLSCIEEAEAKLSMARDAIESRKASSLLAARSLFNEAIGFLTEAA